ncbi:hypothetical protein [Cytophaga aurantiaca]|uniref:hypothetical protein n=1 Tax=Cytophaga aurantiaca TaxID=29530 RepID=UPI000370E676|nr:hypothetical protein [Cytophaga aurantiaca]
MYVLYCSGTFAQTDNVVNSIRKAVEQINADKSLTTKTLDNEQFLEQTTDRGGQLTGYFKNGILVKIVERIGLSSCVDINEYYIQDNKLIFVYAQGKEFKYIDSSATFNSSFQTVTMECRFYFQEDKLLKSVLSGSTRCEGKPSESWFKKYQDKYVRYVLLLTNE